MSRLVFLFLLFCPLFAFASDFDIYLISGVSVSTAGKSPALAKTTAHNNARRDAFVILLGRLKMKEDIVETISEEELSDMVRSEQIENERIAGSSYSATFNIMFAKDFVEHILAQKNSPVASEKQVQETLVLIPVKLVGGKPTLWGDGNDWLKMIDKNLQKKSLKNFVIPEADIVNIATLDDNNLASPDYVAIEPLLSRYKAVAAYNLVFAFDEIENKATINVIRISRLQKKQVKLGFVNVDLLSQQALLDKVADKVVDYLVTAQKTPSSAVGADLTHIKVYLSSLGKWLMVKGKIESSNLVNQLNIESISRDYVAITVNYIGKGSIEESFARAGLSLVKTSENSFTIDAN